LAFAIRRHHHAHLVIVAYFIVVFGIGIYHSRRQRTPSEYVLAGDSVGWFAVGASLFSPNISSEHFIGLAGSGDSDGLAVGCVTNGRQASARSCSAGSLCRIA
jgi:Na+/proline symporter